MHDDAATPERGLASRAPAVLAILGMHRSGTSCLAGILQCMGIPSGRVELWNYDNEKGNRESPAIMRLNDSVLASSGGAWNAPPPAKLLWNGSQASARDALLARNTESSPLWMFKDPRTLLTLPFWLEAVPELAMIGTFRHPLRVAASLYVRNRIRASEGLALWVAYNEILWREYEARKFPIVCFDLPPESYLRSVTAAISAVCGDFIARGDIRPELGVQFYDRALVHQEQHNAEELQGIADGLEDLLGGAQELYGRLRIAAGLEESLAGTERAGATETTPLVVALHAADLFSTENRPEEAMGRFRALLRQHASHADIWRRMLALLKLPDQTGEALELYREAIADCPSDAALWLDMSRLQWRTGDHDGALSTVRHAIELAPSMAEAWIQKGKWLSDRKQSTEAAGCFQQAQELKGVALEPDAG